MHLVFFVELIKSLLLLIPMRLFGILFLGFNPGTIRGDYAVTLSHNVIHGSDSLASAEREIGLWFPEGLAE